MRLAYQFLGQMVKGQG